MRILLAGRAVEHAAIVRAALAEHDSVVGERPADVVVVPAEEWVGLPSSARDRDAFSVVLGSGGDVLLDPAVDAVWLEPPGVEEARTVIERARHEARRRESRALSPALESIVASLETRDASLRALLAREKAAILEPAPSPLRIGESRGCIEVEDVAVFVGLVRHEIQRARREGTRAILFPLDGPDAPGIAAELRAQDVVLRRRAEGDVALRTDVSPAQISRARLELRERAAVLPDEEGAAALLRFGLRR